MKDSDLFSEANNINKIMTTWTHKNNKNNFLLIIVSGSKILTNIGLFKQ